MSTAITIAVMATTEASAIRKSLPFSTARVVCNTALLEALATRGAVVTRVPVYRWALPDDVAPLVAAARAIAAGTVDVVLLTTAMQIVHLLQVAEDAGCGDDVVRGLDAWGPPAPAGPDSRVSVAQLKVFADGIPRSRTAWLREPYEDSCSHGHLQLAGDTDDEKVAACTLSKAAGADFVKTSTGFGPGGATPADVALMRRVVGEDMGVKAAGGVRDLEGLKAMVAAGASRVGASAGVKIVQQSRGAAGADTIKTTGY